CPRQRDEADQTRPSTRSPATSAPGRNRHSSVGTTPAATTISRTTVNEPSGAPTATRRSARTASTMPKMRLEAAARSSRTQPELAASWNAADAYTSRSPLGDQPTLQVPSKASACRLRFVGSVPAACMTHTSASPLRSETKAISVPLPEKAGTQSEAGSVVSCVGTEVPLAGTTQMSSLPERVEPNAIQAPSGDQAGLPSMAGSPATT